jgi:outer membrane protein OmpA-like peptidoglycan-associated protein
MDPVRRIPHRGKTIMRPAQAIVAFLLFAPGLAAAQSNPSAQDILNALKPRQEAIGAVRGLRPASAPAPAADSRPQPAASVDPAHVVTAAMQADAANQPSIDLTVQFAFGSADLTPAAARAIDELGKALTDPDLAGSRIRIEGHTDTVGTRPYNQTLSERRADTVVEYLNERFHVPAERLQAVGVGEDGLLVPTPDQTLEPRNRRVHVVNLDG